MRIGLRVFITGGAGYVGAAVTRALVAGGHEVVGLARRGEHEARLRATGATAVAGDLAEPSSYRAAAASADAIVHLANPPGAEGRFAVEALLGLARAGRVRHFIHTSVLFVLGDTPEGADESSPVVGALYADRGDLEREVLSAGGGGIITAVVRPGMVYGGGLGGAVSEMLQGARDGVVRYPGEGENRWSLVHRDDAAALFRMVIERSASGVFHATDDRPMRVREVAARAQAAAGTGARLEPWPVDDARRELGRFADALCLDQPVSSPRSRDLGWSPRWTSFDVAADAASRELDRELRG